MRINADFDRRIVLPTAEGGLGLDAVWSDDFHHAVHATLTGEKGGYYVDFAGGRGLARAIAEGFAYQGEPSEYFERQGFVTCEADDHFLPVLLQCFSDKKLLFSTDYPHMESPYPNTLKTFFEQKISEESRMRIGSTNALDAYPRMR